MSRIVYVNGAYLPYGEAAVHVEDRGYQFADAIYEVCEIHDGAIIDETRHLKRLDRSLRELKMARPMSDRALGMVMREVVRRNRVVNGTVYIQVSRGTAPREFLFPKAGTPMGVVVIARSKSPAALKRLGEQGIGVLTMPEMRWKRPDIKTVQLLASSLAKEKAREIGASEAWFVDEDGFVTEGGSSNAWIVTADGELVTRQADNTILNGVTRLGVMDLAAREGIRLVERPFTVAEAKAAREAFVTSASGLVMPVVRIDDQAIGNGAPGSIATLLRGAYHSAVEAQPVKPRTKQA